MLPESNREDGLEMVTNYFSSQVLCQACNTAASIRTMRLNMTDSKVSCPTTHYFNTSIALLFWMTPSSLSKTKLQNPPKINRFQPASPHRPSLLQSRSLLLPLPFPSLGRGRIILCQRGWTAAFLRCLRAFSVGGVQELLCVADVHRRQLDNPSSRHPFQQDLHVSLAVQAANTSILLLS